jgi:hypothetical protein
MQIVVTELPIADAVARARVRFERADQRLSRVLAVNTSALPWMVAGALAVAGGAAGVAGLFPLPGGFAPVMGVLAVLGGAFLGYGLPAWSQARSERKRRTREWHHALEMLRLREQQAEDNPELTVEVLDRVERSRLLAGAKWNTPTSVATRYVQ